MYVLSCSRGSAPMRLLGCAMLLMMGVPSTEPLLALTFMAAIWAICCVCMATRAGGSVRHAQKTGRGVVGGRAMAVGMRWSRAPRCWRRRDLQKHGARRADAERRQEVRVGPTRRRTAAREGAGGRQRATRREVAVAMAKTTPPADSCDVGWGLAHVRLRREESLAERGCNQGVGARGKTCGMAPRKTTRNCTIAAAQWGASSSRKRVGAAKLDLATQNRGGDHRLRVDGRPATRDML